MVLVDADKSVIDHEGLSYATTEGPASISGLNKDASVSSSCIGQGRTTMSLPVARLH